MMERLRQFKLFGSRTLKTGISVFITALICGYFGWPVIFAVITAIVTIEHTAADSIRKAAIRFPASAIGALIATTLYGVFGKGALTYALVAMLTIAICHKLKLQDGILVATITATAMIPDFQENYIVSFFIRLGTTSIGIVVSSLVNFFLLPPNYFTSIHRSIDRLYGQAADLLELILKEVIGERHAKKGLINRRYQELTKHMEQTHQLSQYQREEWSYHKHTNFDMRAFQFAQKKLDLLQQIIYHLGNLQYIHTDAGDFNHPEKHLIGRMIPSFVAILRAPEHEIPEEHFKQIEELDHVFWDWKQEHIEHESRYRHHLPPQTVLLYELLCLHDVMEELKELSTSKHAAIYYQYVKKQQGMS
ncbi:FUSC family protein [Thalassobacillus devorans]|uniref:FUSC family protein n=1 Tax=Thalassobacillus devorans TaxID=279813 RepID=UPI000A1CB6BB|nr:aromatic acid exporter family protein [Thalassobacillus devorans]